MTNGVVSFSIPQKLKICTLKFASQNLREKCMCMIPYKSYLYAVNFNAQLHQETKMPSFKQ